MNWCGNDPALRLVEELEAGAALARLDAQRHLAEWPAPPVCFLWR